MATGLLLQAHIERVLPAVTILSYTALSHLSYVVSFLNIASCCLQDELPEALLGAVRLQNLDLSSAAVLDLETGHITRKS